MIYTVYMKRDHQLIISSIQFISWITVHRYKLMLNYVEINWLINVCSIIYTYIDGL